jgi:hypothetical protein
LIGLIEVDRSIHHVSVGEKADLREGGRLQAMSLMYLERPCWGTIATLVGAVLVFEVSSHGSRRLKLASRKPTSISTSASRAQRAALTVTATGVVEVQGCQECRNGRCDRRQK